MPPTQPDALLPVDVLAAWLDDEGIAPGEPIWSEPLRGGVTNVMLRIRRAEHQLVVRRPAKRSTDRADDGMRREYRILEALAGSDVPHPRAVALCNDMSRLGCVFYAMEDIDGISALERPEYLTPQAVTAAAIEALAALHELDYAARGLADLGQPGGFHERQVSRWAAQHARDGGRAPERLTEVGRWLEQHLPSEWTPALMHGDYHMLNLLLARDPPARVAAIVDWETATIGDPLLDLAGFREVWTSAFRESPWPDGEEIVERYVAARGLGQVPDLRYYATLYNFRMAVLLEGVYQRSLRDDTRPDNELAGRRAQSNLARAEVLVEG
jgi:aminoglycoside phosphotransferase (APT) family kinase protein